MKIYNYICMDINDVLEKLNFKLVTGINQLQYNKGCYEILIDARKYSIFKNGVYICGYDNSYLDGFFDYFPNEYRSYKISRILNKL